MRIGVTGAAGFIGSHVCERLLADGHEVLGVDAFTRFYARELKEANLAALRRAPGFELGELNLLDHAALCGPRSPASTRSATWPGARACAGARPPIYEAGNVRTTEAVLAAAANAGVRRVLLASSSSVYGRGDRPGGRGRAAPAAVPVRALQAPGRAGGAPPGAPPRDRAGGAALLHGLRAAPAPRHGVRALRERGARGRARCRCWATARQVRDFTYVGDAADATALALERGARTAARTTWPAGARPRSRTPSSCSPSSSAHAGARPRPGRPARPAEHGRRPRPRPARARMGAAHRAGRGPRPAGRARRGRGALTPRALSGCGRAYPAQRDRALR